MKIKRYCKNLENPNKRGANLISLNFERPLHYFAQNSENYLFVITVVSAIAKFGLGSGSCLIYDVKRPSRAALC